MNVVVFPMGFVGIISMPWSCILTCTDGPVIFVVLIDGDSDVSLSCPLCRDFVVLFERLFEMYT